MKEYCEARKKKLDYPEIERTGPAHEPFRTVECQIDGEPISRGSGRKKKDAEQEAAREALRLLGE